MNTIGKMIFDFKMENEEFAHSLYARWDNFFANSAERITDEVLGKYDKRDSVIEIDCLDLDLGTIEEDAFNEHFPLLFRQKLEDALLQCLNNSQHNRSGYMPEKDYLFGILCRFLLHGTLPWSIADKYKNIGFLFLTVLKNDSKKLKAFLQTYGHYTGLQQRLVFHLDDPLLEDGVRLLAPGESVFIYSYIHLLKEKYNVLENNAVRESDYRDAVWLVVYAYLLTNRSSYFNKKSFIASTVNGLAVRYNLSYDHFLGLLVSQLSATAIKLSAPAELYLILDQLKKELYSRRLSESVHDLQKLYLQITSEMANGKESAASENLLALKTVLANENTCRRFLQLLQEEEIIYLVQTVIPDASSEVVGYAQTLDAQHRNRLLEGRAGGEFRLLKWQIIFPVLLEGDGTAFNYKYFVRNTIGRIAAHYNLDIVEVLVYICSHAGNADSRLMSIFNQLLSEHTSGEKLNDNDTASQTLSFAQIKSILKNKEVVSLECIALLISTLSDPDMGLKLAKYLSEEEHFRLISLIIPSESYFLLPYARVMDVQQDNPDMKITARDDFRKIKWAFIYGVLFASKSQVFNRKYFVDRTLNKLAAHYNTTVRDLLFYFYREKVFENVHLPFDLIRVLEELKADYNPVRKKDKTGGQAEGKRKREENSRKILETYFGKDASLTGDIIELSRQYEFVRFIDNVLQVGNLLREYLRTGMNVITDKKRILRFLIQLSPEYRYLSREDILLRIISLIMQELDISKQALFLGKIENLSRSNSLLKNCSDIINYKKEMIMDAQNLNTPQEEFMYADNAGIVLIAPYLPRFFSMLSLIEGNKFRGEAEQLKAIAALRYVAVDRENDPDEHSIINRLLTGMEISKPMPRLPELTKEEKDVCESLLKGVLANWQKMKNTSFMAFREAFLMRQGKVEIGGDVIHLTVEEKPYDILLDSLPWNFRIIKFPWMEKRIEVKWR